MSSSNQDQSVFRIDRFVVPAAAVRADPPAAGLTAFGRFRPPSGEGFAKTGLTTR